MTLKDLIVKKLSNEPWFRGCGTGLNGVAILSVAPGQTETARNAVRDLGINNDISYQIREVGTVKGQ